ncbi:MCE family protein [Solihabitans fulvus]|uniref:MCE family protein n=1 Tax=Solihabitans fulvus TaxID=1892852 RepID=A0A5B2XPX1_9PSEU|nr:MCE family protein [Solihabitans fulvus]KAA2264909.1 MCE family protein [Solihabitans fulvus]
MRETGSAAALRRRLLGIAFILVICSFLALTVAMYRNAFTSTVRVTVRTDHLGSQLQPTSDVKVRGMIVGEVRQVRSRGDGAEIELALQPDKVQAIPRTVSVRLLPKSLFGERYVALVLPGHTDAGPLVDGDVIDQDHSAAAVELEQVLADLMPVLQAVQPEKLSTTLTAMSQALSGRGAQLGQTLAQLDQYLGQVNPQLPTLDQDIARLADVANTYADAGPDLVGALSDLTVTSRTVAEQRMNLDALYASLRTGAQDLTGFLRANRDNLIQVASTSRPTLDLVAKYAPEYPCIFNGITTLVPRYEAIVGAGTDKPGVHITMEITANRGRYVPGQDEPKYQDKRGPRCYLVDPMPNPVPQYPPEGPIKDGSKPPPPARSVNDGVLPPALGNNADWPTAPSSAASAPGLPNSPQERDLLAVLLAPSLGVPPAEVPEWSGLLVGPLFRGAVVEPR